MPYWHTFSLSGIMSDQMHMEELRPTAYEQQIMREIHAWRTRTPGAWGRAVAKVNSGLQHVTGLALKVPGVKWTLDNVVAGLLQVVNELAQDTLWRDSIYAEFCRRGYQVSSTDDIHALRLQVADATLKGVDVKYRSVTAAQGVAAGIAGAAGILPDIIGLVALNLRAVGEYATYFGFDMDLDQERMFALQILHAQAQPSLGRDAEEGLMPIRTVSQSLAERHTRQTVQQLAVSASVKSVVRALGRRLTAIKLAQIMPMAGALIGGGANALYTTSVCNAALHLYRERRLLEKYSYGTLDRYDHG